MSNETLDKQEQELEAMKDQINELTEADKAKAAKEEEELRLKDELESETPHPEPEAKEPEKSPEPNPVTEPSDKKDDDPMEWAKKKGLKTPEDMARLLRQKEQEFHQSRQKQEPAPQMPTWNPTPQAPNYGYPPPVDPNQQFANLYPHLDPETVKNAMPLIRDVAEAVAFRRTLNLERQIQEMQQMTVRNNEIMTLMQDPAFQNPTVQREIHNVLDSDPSIFQRERLPVTYAYERALGNMARKQLQQGVGQEPEARGTKPPVTAGGGNGSANTMPKTITQREFDKWSIEDQKAYINSGGRKLPKK